MTTQSEMYFYYGLPIVITLSILLIIIMVMALVGNVLVITTILRNKYMRTRTNILLCNLALADIVTALLDIPVAVYTLNTGRWSFSKAFCYFNAYLVGLGLMLSIHTLMWISIHKFISITRPLAPPMTPGKIFLMILAAWAWALSYNLAPVFGWTDTAYKKGASQCGPVIPVTLLQISHSVTNTIFNFIIPICVMSYCYYKIFAEVREHMNRLQEFSDARTLSTIMQQRRITKTLLIVFCCFILCWTPYIIYSSLLVKLGEDKVKPIFNPLAYLATYLNSACNPIIYALRSPSFRKGFQEILFGSKRMPDSPFGNNSFRWRRMNGVMISFRRSLLRSKSNPDIRHPKPGRVPPKYTTKNTSEALSDGKAWKHRRANTLPTTKTENKFVKSPSQISNEQSSAIQKDTPAKIVLRSNSISSLTTPKLTRTPPAELDEGPKVERVNPCFQAKESAFFSSPSPRDKAHFIYFSKYAHHPLSMSAPNLFFETKVADEQVEHQRDEIQNGASCLKLPDVMHTRACSEGAVQPLLEPACSTHSHIYGREVPKLVWQASIEDLNVYGELKQKSRSGLTCDTYENETYKPDKRLSPNDLAGRSTRIPNLLSSMECLVNNFFAPTSRRSSFNCQRSNSEVPEEKSVFYTNEIYENIPRETEAKVLISHL